MSKKIIIRIFITLLFLCTLYMTENPPCGSNVVAEHNGGYGTFDMNNYTYDSLNNVLADTKANDFCYYYRYYVCDFIFIIAFGLFQIMISNIVYSKQNKYMLRSVLTLSVLRGLFDSIENVILLIVIKNYPDINTGTVILSSIITKFKFICMGIWILMILIGIIIRFTKGIKRKNN